MILGSLIFWGGFFKATRKAVDHDIDAWFVPWVLVSAEILQRWYHVLGITGHPGNGDIEMEILPLLWISYCILLWISYVFFFLHSEIIAFPTMATELPIFVKTDIVSGSPSSFCWLDPSIPHMAFYDKTCTPLVHPLQKVHCFFYWRHLKTVSPVYIYISTIYRHVYFTDHISSTSIYIYYIQ